MGAALYAASEAEAAAGAEGAEGAAPTEDGDDDVVDAEIVDEDGTEGENGASK